MKILTVILASRDRDEMGSMIPMVLQPLLGKPIILHALETAQHVSDQDPLVITGHKNEAFQQIIEDRAFCVDLETPEGEGQALLRGLDNYPGDGVKYVLAYTADLPLITSNTLNQLVEVHDTHDDQSAC